jgi:integrase
VYIHTLLKEINEELGSLFILQYESGCRLSEAQLIEFSSIMKNGDIKLKATKNSQDRIVSSGRCADYMQKCRKDKKNPFQTFNRFFIHRLYKKLGIVFQSEKSKKQSTTHAMRHLKVKELREQKIENELISNSIGDKNQKNQEHYGKEKTRK